MVGLRLRAHDDQYLLTRFRYRYEYILCTPRNLFRYNAERLRRFLALQ